jgi:hypothetical protein
MNSTRTFFSLLRFAVSTLPLPLLALPAISIILEFTLAQINGMRGGFEGDVFSVNIVSIPLIMGFMFFNEVTPGATTWAGYKPIPYGEFLFAHPILRTQAYRPRILVYYILILASPLVGLGLASRRPEMTLALYQTPTRRAEALVNLKYYQSAFPDSHIYDKNNTKTLVIPNGCMAAAGWKLFITTLIAVGVQTMVLLPLPKNFLRGVFIVLICLMSLFGLAPIWDKAYRSEQAFLFFAGHIWLAAALTVTLTALVQWAAARRVRQLEVL